MIISVYQSELLSFTEVCSVQHSHINMTLKQIYSCASIVAVRQALIFVNQAVVSSAFSPCIPRDPSSRVADHWCIWLVILAVRTMALYNHSRAIIFGVVGFAAVIAGFAVVSPIPFPMLIAQIQLFVRASGP